MFTCTKEKSKDCDNTTKKSYEIKRTYEKQSNLSQQISSKKRVKKRQRFLWRWGCLDITWISCVVWQWRCPFQLRKVCRRRRAWLPRLSCLPKCLWRGPSLRESRRGRWRRRCPSTRRPGGLGQGSLPRDFSTMGFRSSGSTFLSSFRDSKRSSLWKTGGLGSWRAEPGEQESRVLLGWDLSRLGQIHSLRVCVTQGWSPQDVDGRHLLGERLYQLGRGPWAGWLCSRRNLIWCRNDHVRCSVLGRPSRI